MKILFATSEAAPFVKTGGLGDVMGSLPPALCAKGVDARVILPLYKCINTKYREKMKYIDHIYIDMAWRKQYVGIFSLVHDGATYYFIDNEFYFGGEKPYDFIHLDCEKFIFFSKAALSVLPTIGFCPDVINCNDWQSAAIPIFLDTFRNNPFYGNIKTVMTVHNLKFQGRWNLRGIKDAMGIADSYFTSDKMEYYSDANILKGGMVYADKITTVSGTYAQEIMHPEFGEGLDPLLRARHDDVEGILNGISYKTWDSNKDKQIYENYGIRNFREKKAINKEHLQKELNLPVDKTQMIIGVVSRLTDQKGFDLVSYKMEELLSIGVTLIVLGTGDEKYENLFRHYAWKYPDHFSAQIYFSDELSHKIYAASDAFLMPSLFEPCGLSQMISMRYGTLPIVRETGGLKDTVTPYNEYTGEGCGFSFTDYNADDMMHVVKYAARTYYNHHANWDKIVRNAMKKNYSWDTSADEYIKLYSSITGIALEQHKEKPAERHVKKAAEKPREEAVKEAFESRIKKDNESSAVENAKKAVPPKKVKVEDPFKGSEKSAAKNKKGTKNKARKNNRKG